MLLALLGRMIFNKAHPLSEIIYKAQPAYNSWAKTRDFEIPQKYGDDGVPSSIFCIPYQNKSKIYCPIVSLLHYYNGFLPEVSLESGVES